MQGRGSTWIMLLQIHILVTSVKRGLDGGRGSKGGVKGSYKGEGLWKRDVRGLKGSLILCKSIKGSWIGL